MLLFELDEAASEIIKDRIRESRVKSLALPAKFNLEFDDSVWSTPAPFQGEIISVIRSPEGSIHAVFLSDFESLTESGNLDVSSLLVSSFKSVPDILKPQGSWVVVKEDTKSAMGFLYLGTTRKYGIQEIHMIDFLTEELSGLILDFE